MKNYLFYVLIILCTASCTTYKGIPFSEIPEYESKEGYKNFYFVDTIKINNPIGVFFKDGNEFVMSKDVYELYNGKEDFLLYRSDVFLLTEDLPLGAFSIQFVKEFYQQGKQYCWEIGNKDNLIWINEKKKGISRCYTYKKQPDYFLLFLIRGDYYNHSYCGLDGPYSINFKRNKYNYYKIVIPICK
jgi:hypothetical protein